MKIGVTYDLKTDWVKSPDEPEDIHAELDKPKTVDNLVKALESTGHKIIRIGNVYNLLKQLDNLNVDIVFNITEGRHGRNRESQVPNLLEMKGIPFVGSDALTMGITLDKVVAKQIFISEGIPTPKYFVARENDDLKKLNTIGFPLIVKTRHEGSSKGINEQSVVKDLSSLKDRVAFINKNYKQPALVEEFIAGMEFTVPVLGNGADTQAMPIVQTTIEGKQDLGNMIYTNRRIYDTSVQYLCPAAVDASLAKKIQELAVRAFKAVECRDLARIDFRVDKKGNPYILEINPLPSFDEEDTFHLFPKLFGSSFEDTIHLILNFALKRYNLIKEDFPIFYKEGTGVL